MKARHLAGASKNTSAVHDGGAGAGRAAGSVENADDTIIDRRRSGVRVFVIQYQGSVTRFRQSSRSTRFIDQAVNVDRIVDGQRAAARQRESAVGEYKGA